MKRGVGRTIVLFLLWCFVYFAIYVIGNIVGTSQQFTFFHRFEWTEQCRLSVYPCW